MKSRFILLLMLTCSLSLATACGGDKTPSSTTTTEGHSITVNVETKEAESAQSDSADSTNSATDAADATDSDSKTETLPAEETVEIELEEGEEIGFD